MKLCRYAVAILLLALTLAAKAEDMNSANFYLPGCKGTPDAWRRGLCAGFVEGLAYRMGGEDFCPPKEVWPFRE
jgi:hypothetical protein